MSAPAVSVVVPTFRRPELLRRCLEAILAQRLEDFEVIVVDDASGDQTPDVIALLGDDRIQYVSHDANLGLATARNTGIRHCRAPLISFCDDDDVLLPGFLENACRLLAERPASVGFAVCAVREIDERGQNVATRNVTPPDYDFVTADDAYLAFLQRIPLSGWFVTMRQEVFDEVGYFDEELRTEQDRDLLYRVIQNFEYVVDPEVQALHYFHRGPHVNVYGPKKAEAFRRIIEKNRVAIDAHPKLACEWNRKLGWLHYVSDDRSRGRQYLADALRARPLDPRPWVTFLSYEVLGDRGHRVHRSASRMRKRLLERGRT